MELLKRRDMEEIMCTVSSVCLAISYNSRPRRNHKSSNASQIGDRILEALHVGSTTYMAFRGLSGTPSGVYNEFTAWSAKRMSTGSSDLDSSGHILKTNWALRLSRSWIVDSRAPM